MLKGEGLATSSAGLLSKYQMVTNIPSSEFSSNQYYMLTCHLYKKDWKENECVGWEN